MAGHPALGRVFSLNMGQWVRGAQVQGKLAGTAAGERGSTGAAGGGGGGACRAVAVGHVCGEGVCGGEEGRLCRPSSLGVAGRSRCRGGRYSGATGSLGLVFGTGACAHPTLLVHLPEGGARALSCGALHPARSPRVELGSTKGVVWCSVV